jgi:hypothetical protein
MVSNPAAEPPFARQPLRNGRPVSAPYRRGPKNNPVPALSQGRMSPNGYTSHGKTLIGSP